MKQGKKRDSAQSQAITEVNNSTGILTSTASSGWLKLPLIILVLAMLVTTAFRLRLLDVPLERDEGEYAYVGQQLLHGIPPFVSIYHVKLPGIYVGYASVMAVFGQTTEGIHLGLLLINLLTAVVVYFVGKRVLNALTGALAAACFLFLTLSQALQGFSANAEHFVLLPAMLGLLFLLRGFDYQTPDTRIKKALNFFAAGLMLGYAYTTKQHALFYTAFAAVFFVYKYFSSQFDFKSAKAWGDMILNGLIIVAGLVIPLGIFSLIFWHLGLFEKFWWWTWYYPRIYISQISLEDGMKNFKWAFHPSDSIPFAMDGGEVKRTGIWDTFYLLLLVSLWGAVSVFREMNWTKAVFSIGLFVFTFMAASAGLVYYPHYFLLVVPAVAYLAAIGATSLPTWLGKNNNGFWVRNAGLVVVFIVLSSAVLEENAYLFNMDGTMVDRITFGRSPFPESPKVGQYIAEHTNPKDRIAVIGSEPQIYFYAKRRASTGFVYTYEMVKDHPYVDEFQKTMAREIEETKPKYIVMINMTSSWFATKNEHMDTFIFTWSSNYLQKYYEQTGIVNMPGPGKKYGTYCWDRPDQGCQPTNPMFMTIYHRKDN